MADSDARADLSKAPYADFEYPRSPVIQPCGGTWRAAPETFRVEELPLYPFLGEGEHVIVRAERAGRTTRDLVVGVAHRLGIAPHAIGYAGMKDKGCVATQAFSLAGTDEAASRLAFEAEGCTVLEVTRHRNKLRLGHLAGNRFRVWLRGADVGDAAAAADALGRHGVPNYYGPQRFGARGDNAAQGHAVLLGRLRAGRWKRDLLVSALQSFVFNEVLARRLETGTLAVAMAGDVLRREDSGGLFQCAEPEVDTPRVRAFEVAPTGPMPGRKMVRPAGQVAAAEAAVLAGLGLKEDLFRRETGSRRPLRVPVREVRVEPAPDGVWIEFACPAGAYATNVVRELIGT